MHHFCSRGSSKPSYRGRHGVHLHSYNRNSGIRTSAICLLGRQPSQIVLKFHENFVFCIIFVAAEVQNHRIGEDMGSIYILTIEILVYEPPRYVFLVDQLVLKFHENLAFCIICASGSSKRSYRSEYSRSFLRDLANKENRINFFLNARECSVVFGIFSCNIP